MTDDQTVTQADVEAFCEEASVDAKWILDGGGTSGVRNMVWAGARIIARHRTAHSGEGPCPMCLGVRIVAGEVCERCRGVGYLNLRSGDLAPGLERAAHSGEGRSNGAGEDALRNAAEEIAQIITPGNFWNARTIGDLTGWCSRLQDRVRGLAALAQSEGAKSD